MNLPRATTSDCRGSTSISCSSAEAGRQVFSKGVFDIVLGLFLIICPYVMRFGIVEFGCSDTLGNLIVLRDSSLPLLLGAITVGTGYSAVKASYTDSDDAYQLIATFSVVQAFAILTGYWIYPETPLSALLLAIAAEDILWFVLITMLGDYGIFDTLGLRMRSKMQQKEVNRQNLKAHVEDVLVMHEDPSVYREALRLGL
ncbi:hypothetical protein BDQ17DRAFT_1356329 [Cyathus striatus]|nr:hypothetical protein BDQ17DRAFT_1356329 [Cyathus striatus]